jgi:hypothetical protein
MHLHHTRFGVTEFLYISYFSWVGDSETENRNKLLFFIGRNKLEGLAIVGMDCVDCFHTIFDGSYPIACSCFLGTRDGMLAAITHIDHPQYQKRSRNNRHGKVLSRHCV